MKMQIYPAIDLRNQHCVRLYQGKFDRATIYNENPLQTAKEFAERGAKWLHLINLDAAKDAHIIQLTTIAKIIKTSDLKVQLGGGIRSKKQITDLFDLGLSRVIIGSLALQKPELVKNLLAEFDREKIVLAFDVSFKNNAAYLALFGWQKISDIKLFDMLEFYYKANLKHLLCTDISRDGTMRGPNLKLYKKLLQTFPNLQLQASGGIASLADLKSLAKLKVAGAIIGRALYEKKIDLKEALKC